MDSVFAMALALLGILGWIVGARRHMWALIVAIPAVPILVLYFAVELARSQPEITSGRVEMSLLTVLLISFGVVAMITDGPKPPTRGGLQSG